MKKYTAFIVDDEDRNVNIMVHFLNKFCPNIEIIGTSNFWKFDFYTNLFYIILSLPLNIFLINSYGLEGLAFSNLVALTLYNSIRFGFLYKKFNLQPYTWRHGIFLISSIILMLLVHQLPIANNFFLNIFIQSATFSVSFYLLVQLFLSLFFCFVQVKWFLIHFVD